MTTRIHDFFNAWGLSDDTARALAIRATLAPEATYGDPRTPAPLNGPEEIAAYVAQFAQAAPGASASVVADQTQHGLTRATVAFTMADGMQQLGQYFITLNDAGAITAMTGFVGTGAPA